MNILILIVCSIVAVISLLCLISRLDNVRVHMKEIKALAITFFVTASLVAWAGFATAAYYEDTQGVITMCQIQSTNGVPFYINDKSNIIQMNGDWKFADPKTTKVRITDIPSGFKYGMYVIGNCSRELVTVAVENKP